MNTDCVMGLDPVKKTRSIILECMNAVLERV